MLKYRKLLAPKQWIVIKSLEQLQWLLQDLQEYPRVAFDTETTGLLDSEDTWAEVFGVSFAVGDKQCERCYWFSVIDNDDEELEKAVIEVIRDIFTSGNHWVLFFNAKFDIQMVRRTFGIEFTHNKINDVMLLAVVLQKFYKNDLKGLSSSLLRRTPEWATQVNIFFDENKVKKDDRLYSDLPENLVAGYAMEDAANTFDLFFALLNLYRTEPATLQNIYRLERELVLCIADLEYNGMCLNMEYLNFLKDKLQQEIVEDDIKAKELWGEEFSFTKARQIGRVMFEDTPNGLHLDPGLIKRTPTGEYATDADYFMDTLANVPLAHTIVMHKFKNIVLTRFAFPLLTMSRDHDDGERYIHTKYWQILATGRLSASNPPLQQMPNDKLAIGEKKGYSVRMGFKAPPGFLYVSMDFKAFEVAVLANASQDVDLVHDILTGEDFHSRVASIAYHRPYDDIKNKIDAAAIQQRTASKRTSFLMIYGGGIDKAVSTGLTYEEAEAVKRAIREAYPQMHSWKRYVGDEAGARGYALTLCGRKCIVSAELAYRAVNMICQGTAADVIKYGHVDVYNLLRNRKSRQVLTLHDEVHIYLHPEDADLVPDIVAAFEKRRFDPPLIREAVYVPMRMELSMSTASWAEMRETTVEGIQNKLRSM